jgi:DNA-binding transcriptional ArsR family regulator
MATNEHKTSVCLLPAIAGTGLCIGAVALLTSDAFSSGHVTVMHALQPLLIIGAIAAAVQAHRSLTSWRPVSALAFVALALLGSLACAYGTLGRMSEARDVKTADALASNRQLTIVNETLQTAKADAARECKSGVGTKCTNASARVDKLVGEMASLRTVSPDPRADAIADLLHLVASADKVKVRAIVAAVDPLVLPLFLELGSILFFAVAFPTKRKPVTTIVECNTPQSMQSFTREQALRDLAQLKHAGSGRYLAQRWGVDPSTASRWLQSFEASGAIDRNRSGKSKTVLAIAGPRR